MKTKEWVRRSARTFFQAFAGMVSATLVASVTGISDIDTLKTALIGVVASGIAAGIAAIMNYQKEESEEV